MKKIFMMFCVLFATGASASQAELCESLTHFAGTVHDAKYKGLDIGISYAFIEKAQGMPEELKTLLRATVNHVYYDVEWTVPREQMLANFFRSCMMFNVKG